MAKRTLDSFFKPISPPTPKRPKPESSTSNDESSSSPKLYTHSTYPIAIPELPSHIEIALVHGTPALEAKSITNQPHLDLLQFQPYITRPTANELFKFLRQSLPFYRVQYEIKRGGIQTKINTPRYTTVFGVDDTSIFVSQSHPTSSTSNLDLHLINTSTKTPISATKYQYAPRPIPPCLETLRQSVEKATGSRYNFCLVNYYASGEDSISFHSDDERFLGAQPNIASLSLGGEREFHMKHKPIESGNLNMHGSTNQPTSAAKSDGSASSKSNGAFLSPSTQTLKMGLLSGDMIVMRGDTQANWLHSIPKRRGRGGDAIRGRINITFRKAIIPAGTNNYYHYNVGSGPIYRWDEERGVMDLMKAS
ncbi:Oxoglutarate/iron-dependent dioxygenase [Penicillium herquei]|nr:Oxoglutarate/iron-dependent dioxygenase [Penicillium herquei]